VDVVGAHHVADAVAAVESRALALRAPLGRPAGAGHRPQTDRAHLIEGDHRPTVRRRRGPQFQHPRGLGLIVGIRAGLPGAGALKRQPGVGQHAAQMRRADLNGRLLGEMVGQPGQRPARQWCPLRVGTGTGHRDRLAALIVGDPAGTPAPILRVQRGHPALIEIVDDPAHMRLVGHPHRRDLRHRVTHVRGQQHRRPLTGGEVLGLLGPALERRRFCVLERPDEHLRGTHPHLHRSDASPFAIRGEFPVKRWAKAH